MAQRVEREKVAEEGDLVNRQVNRRGRCNLENDLGGHTCDLVNVRDTMFVSECMCENGR